MAHQAGTPRSIALGIRLPKTKNKKQKTKQRNSKKKIFANMSDRNDQAVNLRAAPARYSRRRNVRLHAGENCFRARFLGGILI
jgi:hypothetical protein